MQLSPSWLLVQSCPVDFYGAGGLSIMDRDNIALVVALEDVRKGSRHRGRRFVVANTHLLFNTKRGDVTLCQLHHLMHVVHQLYQQCAVHGAVHGVGEPGVLVTGDFNCTPNSALYQYMARGVDGVDLGGCNRTE